MGKIFIYINYIVTLILIVQGGWALIKCLDLLIKVLKIINCERRFMFEDNLEIDIR